VEVVVSVKVTVPAAVEGDTVAASVMLVFTVVVFGEAEAVMVVAVGVVDELPERLLEPQPAAKIVTSVSKLAAVTQGSRNTFISYLIFLMWGVPAR
jgi:hypothetical protein